MSINNVPFRPASFVKQILVRGDSRPRRLPFGLCRGLVMEIDLRHESQMYLGLYERETHALVRRAAGRCGWAMDVGAGKGELCLYLLCHSRISAIIAAEPDPSQAEALQRNLRLNDLDQDRRFAIHQRTIGTRPADLSLDDAGAGLAGRGFVKIDVDGSEMDVLRSGEHLLAAAVDLLVETHSAELERECLGWLADRGYQCRVIPNATWRLLVPEKRPIAHNRWLWASNAVDA